MPGFFIFSGQRMREVRERQGMSREQLAIAASLSASAIAVYELGYRRPSREALLRLAAALGVLPVDLVNEDPMFAGRAP